MIIKEIKLLSFFKGAIIVFWLVMMGLLIYKNYGETPRERISFATVKDTLDVSEEWMGIYFKGEKVGYAVTITKRVGDKYEIFEHSLMHVTMLGEKQRIESKLKTVVNIDFSLESFDLFLASGEAKFSLQGTVVGKMLNLTMTSGENKTQSTFPLTEVPYISSTLKSYVLKHGLEVGKKYRLPFFDPSTMSSSEILIEVMGKEEVTQAEQSIMAYRLKESFKGIETLVWISEGGETLKEESPMGLTLLQESRENALSGEWAKGTKSDLVLMTAVPSDKSLPNPRESKHLKIKFSNVSLEEFDLDGGRQHLRGDMVDIWQEDPVEWENYSLPYKEKILEQYLKPTPFIQSNDVKITSLAKDITKGVLDAETAARMLVSWVYKNIEKKPTMSIPSSLEVLELKSGDCNEHTALFAALARSLGIPTRICVGIVYMERSFYYHAWPEIFLGQWVAVDPTFNQFPADATHIRFVVGDLSDQIKILKIVGQLQVAIVEYS